MGNANAGRGSGEIAKSGWEGVKTPRTVVSDLSHDENGDSSQPCMPAMEIAAPRLRGPIVAIDPIRTELCMH